MLECSAIRQYAITEYYEHLFSGRYLTSQRGSRANFSQVAAATVAAPSAQTSWVARARSSGEVCDGDTKIMNAPTYKINIIIMMIAYVIFMKSRTSRNCFGELRHV